MLSCMGLTAVDLPLLWHTHARAANDATVKGGTYYPITVKKHLRLQVCVRWWPNMDQ